MSTNPARCLPTRRRRFQSVLLGQPTARNPIALSQLAGADDDAPVFVRCQDHERPRLYAELPQNGVWYDHGTAKVHFDTQHAHLPYGSAFYLPNRLAGNVTKPSFRRLNTEGSPPSGKSSGRARWGLSITRKYLSILERLFRKGYPDPVAQPYPRTTKDGTRVVNLDIQELALLLTRRRQIA